MANLNTHIAKQIQDAEVQVEATLSAADRRAESLDGLLCQLLSTFGGLSPRATDGLVLLREENVPHAYFGVAKVSMISDQSMEPATFELELTPDSRISSGRVRFGLAEGRLPCGVNSRGKLEAMMFAYPREVIALVPWAITFERTQHGWGRGRSEGDDKERA